MTKLTHQVSVLIWKTQDRMCKIGHPLESRDGLRKLYDVVLQADSELKRLMSEIPAFFRIATASNLELPVHVNNQSRVLLLTLAHKVRKIGSNMTGWSFCQFC